MSEPMAPASIFEACNSETVVEAEYLGYSKKSWFKTSYFDGLFANYKVLKLLNGKAVN